MKHIRFTKDQITDSLAEQGDSKLAHPAASVTGISSAVQPFGNEQAKAVRAKGPAADRGLERGHLTVEGARDKTLAQVRHPMHPVIGK